MTAYFTASIVGKKHYLTNYLAIIAAIEKRNITVQADHIIKTTEEQIRLETKEERDAFHSQLQTWIKGCSFMVVEATFPSISVGYEISLALHYKKPVLVLYSEGDPPSLLSEHLEDKIVCEKYSNDSITKLIDDFLNYISDTTDSRFTFFITPEISRHLEQMSKDKRLPKSVYLRHLIERDMKLFADS